jgi:hypothetical protein
MVSNDLQSEDFDQAEQASFHRYLEIVLKVAVVYFRLVHLFLKLLQWQD